MYGLSEWICNISWQAGTSRSICIARREVLKCKCCLRSLPDERKHTWCQRPEVLRPEKSGLLALVTAAPTGLILAGILEGYVTDGVSFGTKVNLLCTS